MNRSLHTLATFALAACVAILGNAARAEDAPETVVLVASSLLDGSPLEQTVVVATALPDGTHVGFIINRPTTTRLDALFPNDAGVRNVAEPVYLGGPAMLPGVFALTRSPPTGGGKVLPLLPGLVAVLDAEGIDRLIAETPNDARYFVGLMTWDAGALESQVDNGQWEIQPADANLVLRRQTRGLWNALRGPWARLDTADSLSG